MYLFEAMGSTNFDESELKNLFICDRVYLENGNLTYEADKQELIKITAGVIKELNSKYSRHDAELMQTKAAETAAIEKITRHHAAFCSDTMSRLKEQKRSKLKAYLIPN